METISTVWTVIEKPIKKKKSCEFEDNQIILFDLSTLKLSNVKA